MIETMGVLNDADPTEEIPKKLRINLMKKVAVGLQTANTVGLGAIFSPPKWVKTMRRNPLVFFFCFYGYYVKPRYR